MRLHSTLRVLSVSALLIAIALPASAASQRGGQRPGFGAGPGAGRGGGMATSFEANSPAEGEAMPEVVVYSDAGEPISFRQLLSDHYTVVILGCLT